MAKSIPMLISVIKGIPIIDADGCGRAVPGLETLRLNINGCATLPLAMSNRVNDKITIQLTNPYDELLCEKLGRIAGRRLMTVPDITYMYCVKPVPGSPVMQGMPIPNADVQKGMVVGLGIIRVNDKWNQIPLEHMWNFWKPYMDVIGYTGRCILFEAVPFH